MPATPATSSGASGSPQAMSPWPRTAARSRNTSPAACAWSGIRAAARSRCSATESHRLPNSAATAATIRAVSAVSAHGQAPAASWGAAKTTRASAVTAPPATSSAVRRRGGSGSPARAARRAAAARAPAAAARRRDEVDPRPRGEREPVVREAVEVQRRGERGEPDEDDHGREAGGDARPPPAAQHVGEEDRAGDVGGAEHVGRACAERSARRTARPCGAAGAAGAARRPRGRRGRRRRARASRA